jgi:hypothetical protein
MSLNQWQIAEKKKELLMNARNGICFTNCNKKEAMKYTL